MADAQTVRQRVAQQTTATPAPDAFSVSANGQASQPNQIKPIGPVPIGPVPGGNGYYATFT